MLIFYIFFYLLTEECYRVSLLDFSILSWQGVPSHHRFVFVFGWVPQYRRCNLKNIHRNVLNIYRRCNLKNIHRNVLNIYRRCNLKNIHRNVLNIYHRCNLKNIHRNVLNIYRRCNLKNIHRNVLNARFSFYKNGDFFT